MNEQIDISGWSLGEKMMLPDHAFGVRNLVTFSNSVPTVTTEWHRFLSALPDHIVIWNIKAITGAIPPAFGTVRLALGDVVPTSDAEFNELEQIGMGGGLQTGRGARIVCDSVSGSDYVMLKLLVSPQGRRFVVRFRNNDVGSDNMQLAVIYSAVPRSIPKWMIGL